MKPLGSYQVGFIGVGNMAGAIIEGALQSQLYTPEQIALFDISTEKTDDFVQRGCAFVPSIPELVGQSNIVVLAVKPQQFWDILPEIKKGIQENTLLVSIAAGISGDFIQSAVGFPCKVILAMPNTPLLVGRGATVLAKVSPSTDQDLDTVRALFETAGIVEELPASKMTDSIPIHGSSPAFIYLFAKAIADNAEHLEIPRETAERLIAQTLIGSGVMLLKSGYSAQELIDMVCSPGGTTLAGMKALEESDFEQALENAFSATIWRGKQLAGETPLKEGVTLTTVQFDSEEYQQARLLRLKLLREPLGLSILESDLATDEIATHICAIQQGAVIGTCQLVEKDAFTVKLGQMAVEPEFQNAGIGSMLLWKADQIALEQGYTKIIVHSRMTAKSFYMRQGFLARGSSFLEHGIPHIGMVKELD